LVEFVIEIAETVGVIEIAETVFGIRELGKVGN
jgi:hypothetical protein